MKWLFYSSILFMLLVFNNLFFLSVNLPSSNTQVVIGIVGVAFSTVAIVIWEISSYFHVNRKYTWYSSPATFIFNRLVPVITLTISLWILGIVFTTGELFLLIFFLGFLLISFWTFSLVNIYFDDDHVYVRIRFNEHKYPIETVRKDGKFIPMYRFLKIEKSNKIIRYIFLPISRVTPVWKPH